MSTIYYHCPDCDQPLEIKEFPEGVSPPDLVGNDVYLECHHCGREFQGVCYPTLREAWDYALSLLDRAKREQQILGSE